MELDAIRVTADGEEEMYESAEEFREQSDYVKGLSETADDFTIEMEFDDDSYEVSSMNQAKGLLSDYKSVQDTGETEMQIAAERSAGESAEESVEATVNGYTEDEVEKLEMKVEMLENQVEQYQSDEVNKATVDELVEDENTDTGYAAWLDPDVQAKEAYKVPLGEDLYTQLVEGAEVEVDANGGAIRGVHAMPDEKETGFEVKDDLPDVGYEDVIGLDDQISKLRRKTVLQEQHPEMFEEWDIDKSTGALLYGPPGTGKTMTVQAMANEEDRSLIKVEGPELVSRYVGDAPEQVREIFDKARESAPSLVMIDELDALAVDRADVNDDTGSSERIVGQLLAELDGLKEDADVNVVGTTNQVDKVDDALLRPGRMEKVHVPQPDKEASRELAVANGAPEEYADRIVETVFGDEEYQAVNSGARIEAVVKETAMEYALEELDPDEEPPAPGEEVADEIDWERFEQKLDEVYDVDADELDPATTDYIQ